MAEYNAAALDPMLKSVLSVANQDQSMYYSPRIYQDQYNAVTSLLLSRLCELFPFSQENLDVIQPFLMFKKINVTDGFVQLPDNFRNMLGNPAVVVKPDNTECDIPAVETQAQFKALVLKSKAKTRPLVIVPRSEWDEKTTSAYDFPTYQNPICQYVGNNQLQVVPYDIGAVYVLYAKKESKAVYGYIPQPDDTYIFDPDASTEVGWQSASFPFLFKGLTALYAAYSRDPDLRDWGAILKNGIL